MQREMLAAQERKLGADHPNALMTASSLAANLSDQGKYADAEKI